MALKGDSVEVQGLTSLERNPLRSRGTCLTGHIDCVLLLNDLCS